MHIAVRVGRDANQGGRPDERGQALTEWLLWAAVMLSMGVAVMATAVPVLRRVPAALAGWLATVAP